MGRRVSRVCTRNRAVVEHGHAQRTSGSARPRIALSLPPMARKRANESARAGRGIRGCRSRDALPGRECLLGHRRVVGAQCAPSSFRPQTVVDRAIRTESGAGRRFTYCYDDLLAIEQAIRAAQAETTRPSLISVRTIIGYGSPQEGTSKVHGNPLGAENLRKTKEFYGWDPDKMFEVPGQALEHLRALGERGAARRPSGSGASTPTRRHSQRGPAAQAGAGRRAAAGLGCRPADASRPPTASWRRARHPARRWRRSRPRCRG